MLLSVVRRTSLDRILTFADPKATQKVSNAGNAPASTHVESGKPHHDKVSRRP